jgi:KaiC/GvpD/RAD55 family RecA-like ATPase/5S rRNA maturation endonuclease (ribonuclease M5)
MNLTQAIASRFNVTINGYLPEWVTIACPIHNDNNASAGLNFENQMFNCLAGCGALHFTVLAERLGVIYNGFKIEKTDWLNKLIDNTTPIKPRPLKIQAQQYADFLISKKLKPETIEELGGYYVNDITHPDYGHLVIEYEKGKTFRRRIIDGDGRPHRNTKGEERGFLKAGIYKLDTVILCEGFTDYATLYQIGFRNIAGTLGVQLEPKQLYCLYGKVVFVLFDVDYAGHMGTKKAIEILKEFKATVVPLKIPERFRNGEENKIDINSAYCYDSVGFTNWLQESISRYATYDVNYMANTFLQNNRTVKYVATGIPSLDSALNGGFATGMHAIAGMPEAGKSTLKTYFIDTFVSQDQKVLSVDYELTKEQNWARFASRTSKHSWVDIEKDHSIIEAETVDRLNYLSSRVKVETDWTIEQIKVASKNFDIIIVDYIQRMPYEGDDERAGIKYNARQLGNLCREDGKIVILISSIPRSMYEKSGKAVFKESGDIEYIIQSGYIISKIMPDVMEVEMIKNTRGPSKTFHLNTDYAHQIVREQMKPELRGMLG